MTLKIESWDINRLIPYEFNSKIHDDPQVARIAKSIKEFGWDQPIVVDKHGVIIKGHGRRAAAISLGLREVPVLVRGDLTPDQVRAARVSDNRVALGDIDTNMLKKELEGLNFDLTGIFDAKELDFMLADMGGVDESMFVSDVATAAAEQTSETASKIGEVDERPVAIAKVLGFTTITGKDQRAVVRFMALIEEEFSKNPEAAFVAFAKRYVEQSK